MFARGERDDLGLAGGGVGVAVAGVRTDVLAGEDRAARAANWTWYCSPTLSPLKL